MEGSENRISACREAAGLKQSEMAERLGMSRGQLANIESGNRKVDLPELRRIARICGCRVVDLLLQEDAPNLPSEPEEAMLAALRSEPAYDTRAVLAAVRGVLEACRAAMAAKEAPRALAGDPGLVRGLSDRWNTLDDPGRQKALGLLDAAREFGR